MTEVLPSIAPVIIIPARYQSSRFPGKPLVQIRGVDGTSKSLIERSISAASQVPGATIYVATDDDRIAEAATAAGAKVLMTSSDCANGTERVAEALSRLPETPKFVINFQGDALLTPVNLVEDLIRHMTEEPECQVATVAVRCSSGAYNQLVEDQKAGRVGGTTVVTDRRYNALYFSKRVLPFWNPTAVADEPPFLLHLGLYAYRIEALDRYRAAPVPAIERSEGLEQLRFLVEGIPVRILESEPPQWDVLELNNPTDLKPIEAILASRGIS
jgi:3-deoxy-manno-octulosonate cytidylyltransferase (CMP-KDO synthetase)